MMNLRTLLLATLSLWLSAAALRAADADDDKVFSAIDNLGGRAIRDAEKEGKPVIGADLSGCERVTDATLKELAAFKQLQSLKLACKGVSDAGLKELAAWEQLRSLDL